MAKMKTFKEFTSLIEDTRGPLPRQSFWIDWDGKSKVHVEKVVGDDVHLIRLNRPILVERSQPVRPEDKIIMSKSEFNSAKL